MGFFLRNLLSIPGFSIPGIWYFSDTRQSPVIEQQKMPLGQQTSQPWPDSINSATDPQPAGNITISKPFKPLVS